MPTGLLLSRAGCSLTSSGCMYMNGATCGQSERPRSPGGRCLALIWAEQGGVVAMGFSFAVTVYVTLTDSLTAVRIS